MAQLQSISNAADRVVTALVAGLELEFGRRAGAALAERFLDAEEADFHWDARANERWLRTYHHEEDSGIELDRVRVIGRLDGQWFVAMMIVDGDGNAHGMLARRGFRSAKAARQVFADA